MNNEEQLLKYFDLVETLDRYPSRKECKAAGLKIFQGTLCKRGCDHGFRLVRNGACVDCEASLARLRREMKKLVKAGRVVEARISGRLYYMLPVRDAGDLVKAFNGKAGRLGIVDGVIIRTSILWG